MSRRGISRLPWGDGIYDFRLTYQQIEQLEDVCNAGVARIAERLLRFDSISNPFGGDYRSRDIRETIRLGLMGAGKTQPEALALIVRFIDSRPIIENREIALAIISEVLIGSPDEPVGKAEEPETMKAADSRMEEPPSVVSSGYVVQ